MGAGAPSRSKAAGSSKRYGEAERLFTEVKEIAQKYQHRCDRSKVISKSYWNKDRAVAANAGKPAEGVSAAPVK